MELRTEIWDGGEELGATLSAMRVVVEKVLKILREHQQYRQDRPKKARKGHPRG